MIHVDGGNKLPLADLRVIELGSLLAGPFCGQLLGDFGAEVIKVEDPGVGDPMRQWGREKPYGNSLWWPVVARNKKSITANLRTKDGQDLIRKLVAKADILLENFRPGTLEQWGLSPEELWKIKHFDIVPASALKKLRAADKIEIKAGKIIEWYK